MTTLASLHSGHDVAYFLREREAGGCVGAMSYYTACGEPPGVWAGAGAERPGLTGLVDSRVIEALYMKGVGPDGQRLRPPPKARAALFLHHISRDGDPQLHVHVAIANLAQRADGADDRWRKAACL